LQTQNIIPNTEGNSAPNSSYSVILLIMGCKRYIRAMKALVQGISILIIFLILGTAAYGQDSSFTRPRRPEVKFLKIEPPPKAVLGATIGSQTGLSVLGGLYSDPYAIRVSGGFVLSGWHGAQVDMSYLVSHAAALRHDIALIGGIFRFDDTDAGGRTSRKTAPYVGTAYTVLFQGLHFQIGAAYGAKDYSQILLLFQAGYVFKLW